MRTAHCGICFRLCHDDDKYEDCIVECCDLEYCLTVLRCVFLLENVTTEETGNLLGDCVDNDC